MKIEKGDITRAIQLGKITEGKDRPLLIIIKEETMKRDLFQNLSKLREAEAPFNKVIFTHDLTKKTERTKKLDQPSTEERKSRCIGGIHVQSMGTSMELLYKENIKKKPQQ